MLNVMSLCQRTRRLLSIPFPPLGCKERRQKETQREQSSPGQKIEQAGDLAGQLVTNPNPGAVDHPFHLQGCAIRAP